MIESITFEQFQHGIAPLWNTENPSSIPIYNNPYGIIEYPLAERARKMIVRCVRFAEDGITKGYSSIYNVNDCMLRFRGIYIFPEHRGQGAGHRMCLEMVDLFPDTFYRVFGFYRQSSFERFVKYAEMKPVPSTDWIWSEYSQTHMRMLYRDRAKRPSDMSANQAFIADNIRQYGMGGSNNLGCSWSDQEWIDYMMLHTGNYADLDLQLHF
jgi:predicted GNAT family acetyltransferase